MNIEKPTFLKRLGFKSREEDTTDTVRWICYERAFQSYESQVKLIVQVEFEKFYRDDPFASYTDNVTYSFNRVYLKVIDRQMDEFDNGTYDDDNEKPRNIGRVRIDVQTVSELRSLCKMLSWKG